MLSKSAAISAYGAAAADLFEALGWDGAEKSFSFPLVVERSDGLRLGHLVVAVDVSPIAIIVQGRKGSQSVEITLEAFLEALRTIAVEPEPEVAREPTPLRALTPAVLETDEPEEDQPPDADDYDYD